MAAFDPSFDFAAASGTVAAAEQPGLFNGLNIKRKLNLTPSMKNVQEESPQMRSGSKENMSPNVQMPDQSEQQQQQEQHGQQSRTAKGQYNFGLPGAGKGWNDTMNASDTVLLRRVVVNEVAPQMREIFDMLTLAYFFDSGSPISQRLLAAIDEWKSSLYPGQASALGKPHLFFGRKFLNVIGAELQNFWSQHGHTSENNGFPGHIDGAQVIAWYTDLVTANKTNDFSDMVSCCEIRLKTLPGGKDQPNKPPNGTL